MPWVMTLVSLLMRMLIAVSQGLGGNFGVGNTGAGLSSARLSARQLLGGFGGFGRVGRTLAQVQQRGCRRCQCSARCGRWGSRRRGRCSSISQAAPPVWRRQPSALLRQAWPLRRFGRVFGAFSVRNNRANNSTTMMASQRIQPAAGADGSSGAVLAAAGAAVAAGAAGAAAAFGCVRLVTLAAATTFSAASPMLLAVMIGRPALARISLPRSSLVPLHARHQRLFGPTALMPQTTPSAMVSHFHDAAEDVHQNRFQIGLRSMILNASVTFSVVAAPPPTSRKLAVRRRRA